MMQLDLGIDQGNIDSQGALVGAELSSQPNRRTETEHHSAGTALDQVMSDTRPLRVEGYSYPLARASDPVASHAAAEIVAAGNSDLVKAIRKVVLEGGPQTAWEIADKVMRVHGDRWAEGSIRTACNRAGLEKSTEAYGKSPRGNAAHWYTIRTVNTPSL